MSPPSRHEDSKDPDEDRAVVFEMAPARVCPAEPLAWRAPDEKDGDEIWVLVENSPEQRTIIICEGERKANKTLRVRSIGQENRGATEGAFEKRPAR